MFKQLSNQKHWFLKAIALPALFSISLAFPLHAAEVAGVKVDDRIRVANTDLQLNGSGIRYAAAGLVRVYVVSLYLPQKRTTPVEIGAQRGPKRIHINLLREINSNDFSKGLRDGMRNNLSQADQQKHFDGLLRLGNIFGQIPILKKGETITVDQLPGTGTVILVNGKRVGEPFPDEAFFNALLQIWVGPKPIDESLKPVLLGMKESNDNTRRDENRF
ncbi:MAG: lipoprotein transmembrane [Burkholderiales bacterium]|nr:MAG: lipoprotein transmembrane [Betaproteobacteria bacterium]TAG82836.1 MAG: lipoprotein transmembrane [Burkholderiales bacterium]